MAEVRDQAIDDALRILRLVEEKHELTVIGKPTVTAVTANEI